MMRFNVFLIAFFGISIIHILAEAWDWTSVSFWTKIVLMPLLLLGMLRGLAPHEIDLSIKAVILALIFSTAGDLFLLIEHSNHQAIYFYLGLGSFLLAQLSYIRAFFNSGKMPIHTGWSVVYLLYFAGFILILYSAMPPVLLIAVWIYGFTLIMMAWHSWRTIIKGTGWLKYGGVIGAGLFVISDSLLAINRFKLTIPDAGFWIMTTYLLAQYLIVRSIVVKSRSNLIVIVPTY